MDSKEHIKPSMTILPLLFGLLGIAGVGFMLWKEVSQSVAPEDVARIQLTPFGVLFLVAAVLLIMLRDGCGMYRYHLLTDGQVRLGGLFRIRMLYEFTNAATPSAAGGSTLEMLYLNREGVSISKSTSITLIGLIFDEFFFILICPLLCLFFPIKEIFACNGIYTVTLLSLFLLAYILKVIWIGILSYGVFFNPQLIGRLIRWVFSWRILRKWQERGVKVSHEIEECSAEFRQKSLTYWLKVAFSSFLIWTFRFLIVNMLIMAFNPLSLADNLMVFVRQITTMVIMIIAPTPGGSGFIEVLFNQYLGEFITAPMSVLVITILWRILTYYYYLFLGAIILPKWVTRFKHKQK